MSIHELPMLCLYKGGDVMDKDDDVNHEKILHLELVNSNKDERLINANKHVYEFDEKRLHEAAATEVMHTVDGDKLNAAGERTQTKKKRKEMTTEEKSKLSRDRNREHARNTRLRKKIYVSKLKEFVENLSEQKRAEIKQCSEMGARIHEMHTTRKELVRLFLSYRANNIQDRALWDAILDDEQTFSFTQPYLMYRHFHSNPPCASKSQAHSRSGGSNTNSVTSNAGSSSSVGSGSGVYTRSTAGSTSRSTPGIPSGARSGLHVQGAITPFRKNSGQVVVEGIDGMLVDCGSLKLMVEGLGEGTQAWVNRLFRGRTCAMRYEVSQHGGMIASGDTVICNFCMYTEGFQTAANGTSGEVHCDGLVVPGTLDCKFSTENKIVSVEMIIDVAALIKQYEVMTSLCPSMTTHVLTSLDAIQMNTQSPHVVVCKVPLGTALVVYVNEAYWLSIGVNPASDIAQMENWRGVSIMDFLTTLQHPFNLYKQKPSENSESARQHIVDNINNSFDDQSFFKPYISLPPMLHNQIVGNVENAFVQGRATSCSYCSLSPNDGEMCLNYVKIFPIMHTTPDGMRNSMRTTTYSGHTVSHVLMDLSRFSLYGKEAKEAKSAVYVQYQQYQQEQQEQQQFQRQSAEMSMTWGQAPQDHRFPDAATVFQKTHSPTNPPFVQHQHGHGHALHVQQSSARHGQHVPQPPPNSSKSPVPHSKKALVAPPTLIYPPTLPREFGTTSASLQQPQQQSDSIDPCFQGQGHIQPNWGVFDRNAGSSFPSQGAASTGMNSAMDTTPPEGTTTQSQGLPGGSAMWNA